MNRHIFKSITLGILIGFVTIIQYSANAQTPEANRLKYEHFRERFKQNFVYAPGDASLQGTYIPMELRTPLSNGGIKGYWADGTWWLGHYVAVLATEYRRLQLENQNTEPTLNELKQTLLTYRRLDSLAEICWDSTPALNGFYIRDDISRDMTAKFNVTTIYSDYSAKCGVEGTISNSPSQDQAWASFLGLALVVKLVDNEEVVSLAKEAATMFIQSMQYTDGKKEIWEVVNPVTGMLTQKRADIQWLRYAHSRSYETIVGEKMAFGRAQRSFWKSSWDFLQNNFMIDKRGHFNWYGIMVLSTVINEWGSGEKNIYDWIVKCSRKLSAKRPDLTQPLMFPHLSLLAVVLHGADSTRLVEPEIYSQILDAAPEQGASLISKSGEKIRTEAPWNSMSLFCPWHNEAVGEYNMLDYMLLYNAYALVY
ncbi:MAG: hypothetical protein MJZ76_03670 [Bacteroidales bacterium]|nr:hypothetical protein [Bacteroidales bacterium]